MQTVDSDCIYDGSVNDDHVQVARLLTGKATINSHPSKGVKSKALTAKREGVIPKFHDTVVSYIPKENDVLAVLTLRDIISKDATLDNRNRINFEKHFGATKNALLAQSEICLPEFLAGIFLYTATTNTRLADVQACIGDIDSDYINSFTINEHGITIKRDLYDKPLASKKMTSEQMKNAFNKAIISCEIHTLVNNPSKHAKKNIDHFVEMIGDINPYNEEGLYEKITGFTRLLERYASSLTNDDYLESMFSCYSSYRSSLDYGYKRLGTLYREICGAALFAINEATMVSEDCDEDVKEIFLNPAPQEVGYVTRKNTEDKS
jgi:hypothetical protein